MVMVRASTVLVLCGLLPGLACSSGGRSGADGGPGGNSAGGQAGTAATGAGGAAGTGAGGAATAGVGGGAGAAGGGAAGSGAAGGAGGASSNQALCTSSCAAFTTCGVTTKATCIADCESSSSSYRSCIRAAASNCNNLAMCYFEAIAGTDCPAGGGVPASTATCNATDSCLGTCNTSGGGAPCRCGCQAAASPAVANLLLGIDSCSTAMCASSCTGAGSADCNTCFQNSCQTPRAACLAQ